MQMIRFPLFPARALGGDTVDRHVQFAALPYVETADGIEVCLITSRETGRWVLPKGWAKPEHAPHAVARQEAYEEAGLQGRVGAKALGRYEYVKRLHVFSAVLCRVDVFPLCVETQMLEWPEQPWRRLKWAPPQEAAELVDEADLAALIAGFTKS